MDILREASLEVRGYVLVVDDNEIKRYTTRRVLEQAGLYVEEAVSAAETFARFRKAPSTFPEVVVLDVNLSDADGFAVCRQLKADPRTTSVMVVHLSGHRISDHDQATGLESGADAYLTLPVDPTVLVATVRALLRLHRAESLARRAERYWQVTFDAITDAICLISDTGVVVQCNRAFERLFGKPRDAILQQPVRALFAGDLGAASAEVLAGLLSEVRAKSTVAARVDEISLTGREQWVRVAVEPVPDTDTESGYTVCLLTDETERKTLEKERAALYERERHISETFQNALLTTLDPSMFTGYEVEALYIPAWDEARVGGDFYDMFAIDADRVAMAVGDASGKGLEAAMRAAEIKHVLRAVVWESATPADALRRLNNFVCALEEERGGILGSFVALTLAFVDRATGAGEVCCAGAEPPFLVHPDGAINALAANGPPLGVAPNVAYAMVPLRLAPGETVLLATDGLTEARRPRPIVAGRRAGIELYGWDRLAQSASGALTNPLAPLSDAGNAILADARAFTEGGFQDDVCLLLARRATLPG